MTTMKKYNSEKRGTIIAHVIIASLALDPARRRPLAYAPRGLGGRAAYIAAKGTIVDTSCATPA